MQIDCADTQQKLPASAEAPWKRAAARYHISLTFLSKAARRGCVFLHELPLSFRLGCVSSANARQDSAGVIIVAFSRGSCCFQPQPCLRHCSVCVSHLVFSPSSGHFLWVNGSSFGGPWVLSPWLRGEQGPCSLDMAVFLHPKQSGQYTVWLIERDKAPLALFSTDTLPRITG